VCHERGGARVCLLVDVAIYQAAAGLPAGHACTDFILGSVLSLPVCFFCCGWALFCVAHYIYPIRARFPNVKTGKTEWQTIAYIPFVRSRHGAGWREKERARNLRGQLLQRCIALLVDRFSLASRNGESITLEDGVWTAFPRITLYASDMPEQRNLLGLRLGRSFRPCSRCMVHKDVCGTCKESMARNVRETVGIQLEAAALFDGNTGLARREQISTDHSASPFVPALGAVEGLCTGSVTLYRVFGFDLLHVRWALFSPYTLCII